MIEAMYKGKKTFEYGFVKTEPIQTVSTKKENTENVIKVFKAHGLHASKIGETGGEYIQLNETIKVKVLEARHRWENGLREKL